MARTMGINRRRSSASSIGTAPGFVDSAPMSSTSAPCSTMLSACATAASGFTYRPPSEKESGVTFKTPIMCTRSASGNTRPLSTNTPEADVSVCITVLWEESAEILYPGKHAGEASTDNRNVQCRDVPKLFNRNGLWSVLLDNQVNLRRIKDFFFKECLGERP